MAKFGLLKSIRSLFEQEGDTFYVLDFGHASAKLGSLKIDKSEHSASYNNIVETEHPRHAENTGDSVNVEHISAAIRNTLNELKSKDKANSKQLVIGMASEVIYGHNFSYLHKRENSEDKIDEREVKNILHNAELKAYEDIRKRFVANTGYAETDLVLISTIVQDVRVDGYQVTNPEGFTGKEVIVSVFNAYLPRFYKEMFENVAERLKLNISEMVYEPYTVFHALRRKNDENFEAIILDVGGKTTRVSLARKGKLEEVRTFSFGGESFTHRIASALNIGFWEAENVKLRYSEGKLSETAKDTTEKALQREFSLFLGALEMVLKDFSRLHLLPGDVYVYGGGSILPLTDAIIKKRKWKKDLSFIHPPKIHRFERETFDRVTLPNNFTNISQEASLMAIAEYLIDSFSNKDTNLDRTLNRMAKIIQE